MQYAVILGFLVNFWGNYVYLRDTLKGKTKPNRVSHFLWTLSGMIAFFASVAQGAGWAALPVFVTGSWALITLLASFWNPQAYWRTCPLDWVCGALSLGALVAWHVTQNANWALVLAILSDGLAALPTMVKAWTHPYTETPESYATGAFNAFTSFLAAKLWTFGELAFPTYYFLSCLLIFSVIMIRRASLKEEA
ncbi:MAG: hypothetical protein AB7E52_08155 [Bdellovibrionales bacterium]